MMLQYESTRYLIIFKNNILNIYPHKYTAINFNTHHDLPLKKTLITQNLVIFAKICF